LSFVVGEGFAEAATGVEEQVTFVGDGNVASPAIVLADGIDDHVREMMDIDDDVGDTCIAEALHLPLKERFAGKGNKRLGHGIGEGFEACAETRGKDKTYHNK
jgi:hypothetical protein